jgi:hypothetical protein
MSIETIIALLKPTNEKNKKKSEKEAKKDREFLDYFWENNFKNLEPQAFSTLYGSDPAYTMELLQTKFNDKDISFY